MWQIFLKFLMIFFKSFLVSEKIAKYKSVITSLWVIWKYNSFAVFLIFCNTAGELC